jgi:hypothetical protein
MTASTPDNRRLKHVCERCGRAFARAEHLSRHLLAHDKKKPFCCEGCGVSYGRADVLRRHKKKCAGCQNQPNDTASNPVLPTTTNTNAAMTDQSEQSNGLPESHVLRPLHTGSQTGSAAQQLPPEISDFTFDDDIFLEDPLLFQFNYNHSGLTIPPTPTQAAASGPAEQHISQLQLATPDSCADTRASSSVLNALQITQDELQDFHDNIYEADGGHDLQDFRPPSLSRTLRCIIAYFEHFDPHTPIVHFASLNISKSHPALILIMLAIGAVHLSETQFADDAYEASCVLLTQHDKHRIQSDEEDFPLWHAQASVLCAQYGACTGSRNLFHRAQQHLFSVQTLIYRCLPEIQERRKASSISWSTWIYAETCSRVISWMFVMSSVCLTLDPVATTILPPMPCRMPPPGDESAWHALSEAEWRLACQVYPPPSDNIDLWTIAKSVMVGEAPEVYTQISAFALLSLIGAILATICTKHRLSADIYDPFNGERARMERAISVWEDLWRRHPRAERSMTRLDHPLLNSCLSLLGSSYYHLYLGEELRVLKQIAEDPTCGLSLPACINKTRAYKVIRFAANSWLVRAKLGVAYLQKRGGLELGSQALITAYESGKSRPSPSWTLLNVMDSASTGLVASPFPQWHGTSGLRSTAGRPFSSGRLEEAFRRYCERAR